MYVTNQSSAEHLREININLTKFHMCDRQRDVLTVNETCGSVKKSADHSLIIFKYSIPSILTLFSSYTM